MPSFFKSSLLFLLTVGLLTAPLFLWFYPVKDRHEPQEVIGEYLEALYASDFHRAYGYISAADRKLKSRADYVRERGPLHGVALDAARRLSELIEVRALRQERNGYGSRNRTTVALKAPNANALGDVMLDWDERRLQALPAPERKKLLGQIEQLVREKRVPMIEGEEQFVLVQEGTHWKVFLDWASGVQVRFATTLPANSPVKAEPMTKETVARSGDVFTVGFKVKNSGGNEIVTRIVHRVHPKALSQYLDLVECALLLPVRLLPGEEQIFNSTYVIRGDLPDAAKNIDVNYEFQLQN